MEFTLIHLLLVLVVAWLAGALASKLGYPSLLGELAAGALFGPAALGWLHSNEGLHVLAEIGVFLLLLYIGMEVNYRELMRASKPGLLAGLGGFFVPCILGYLIFTGMGKTPTAALVLGLAIGVTSLTVLSRILVDLDLLGTRVGAVLIAGSVLADTAGLIAFGILVSLHGGDGLQWGAIALSLGKAILFFGITFYVGLRVLPLVGDLLQKTGFNERKANFTLVVLAGLVFAGLAELSDLHGILGAFLAGMFMRGEVLRKKISHEVTTMVHDLSLGFLAPIFFVMAGFHVNFAALGSDPVMLLLVLAVALGTKVVGTAVFYLGSGHGWREGITVGLGMNGHGAVEIIIAEIAFQMGLIEQDLFSMIVVMSFATTAMVSGMLKMSTRWLKARGELASSSEHRSGIIVAGASPLARAMAREFQRSEPVWIIDSNRNRCLAAEAEGLTAINGDVMSEAALDMTGAQEARAFVAMTSNAEVNEVALLNAEQMFGIPDLYKTTSLSAKDAKGKVTVCKHARMLYPAGMEPDPWNRLLPRDEAERVTYPIDYTVDMDNLYVQLAGLELFPLLIEREGKRIFLASTDEAKAGDVVVCLRHREEKKKKAEDDPFDRLVQTCPILDLPGAVVVEEFFKDVSVLLGERINKNPKQVFRLLMRREMESTTVLVPGMAVPHIMVEGLEKTEMVIARCREGVTFFESETEARLVFVLAGPREDRNAHLRILSAIAQLFQESGFEDSLLAVEGPEQLRDIILSTERRRF